MVLIMLLLFYLVLIISVNSNGSTSTIKAAASSHKLCNKRISQQTDLDRISIQGYTIREWCPKFGLSVNNCSCVHLPDGFCEFAIVNNQTNCNSSTEVICENNHQQFRAILILIPSFIGFIGNGIVIIVNIKNWKQTSRCQHLITGLSGIDCYFSLIQIIENIQWLITCRWLYGLAMCKFLRSQWSISALMSLGYIMVIAFERYVGIVHPLNRPVPTTKLYLFLTLNFILSYLSAVPTAVFSEMGNKLDNCVELWPKGAYSLIYSWGMLIIYFLVPLIFIAVLYYRIIKALCAHITRSTGTGLIGKYHVQKRIKDNTKIMLLLVWVVIAYIVLVLPNRIVWVILDHIGIKSLSQSDYNKLMLFALIPYSYHVTVNPIIYSIVDRKFRQNIKLFFTSCCSKQSDDRRRIYESSPCFTVRNRNAIGSKDGGTSFTAV